MMTVTPVKEFTYAPNGVKIEVLSSHDEGEYFMVRSLTTGKVFFAYKNQVVEEVKEPAADGASVKQRRGRQIVKPEVEAFARININSATPQLLTQVLKGVGLKTATEIKELQQSSLRLKHNMVEKALRVSISLQKSSEQKNHAPNQLCNLFW